MPDLDIKNLKGIPLESQNVKKANRGLLNRFISTL
jgi:hypothetical protein